MKYIFFGGQESLFAEIILNSLSGAGFQPAAVFREARKPLDMDYLKSYQADFFLVAAFGKILKKEVIDIPAKGVIGVHPSLLPKYRGPSPIQTALLNDEKETGVALFLIDEKVDHGPIISSVRCQVSGSDNYETLIKKLAKLSVELLIETLPKFVKGEIVPRPQNESEATFTKKFVTEDALVNLTKDRPREIWLKIRALNPEPGVFTFLELKNDKKLRLKLLEADLQNNELVLKKVQPEGKKAMAYQDFLNGYQLKSLSQ